MELIQRIKQAEAQAQEIIEQAKAQAVRQAEKAKRAGVRPWQRQSSKERKPPKPPSLQRGRKPGSRPRISKRTPKRNARNCVKEPTPRRPQQSQE